MFTSPYNQDEKGSLARIVGARGNGHTLDSFLFQQLSCVSRLNFPRTRNLFVSQ